MHRRNTKHTVISQVDTDVDHEDTRSKESLIDAMFQNYYRITKSKEFKKIFKCVVAYSIALIPFYVPSIVNIEPNRLPTLIFLPIGVLINDTGNTIGAMTESTMYFYTALFVSGLSIYMIIPSLLHSPGLSILFLFCILFILHLIKALYPRKIGSSSDTITLFIIDSILTGYNERSNPNHDEVAVILNQIKVYALSGVVSWICSILIYPTWAGNDVRRNMKESLKSLGNLLTIISEFTWKIGLDNSIDDHSKFWDNFAAASPSDSRSVNISELSYQDLSDWRKKIIKELKRSIINARKNFGSLSDSLRETHLEISFSTFHPKHYKSLVFSMQRLLRLLTSIGTTCQSLLSKQLTNPDVIQYFKDIELDIIVFIDLCMSELQMLYEIFKSSNNKDKNLAWNRWKKEKEEDLEEDPDETKNENQESDTLLPKKTKKTVFSRLMKRLKQFQLFIPNKKNFFVSPFSNPEYKNFRRSLIIPDDTNEPEKRISSYAATASEQDYEDILPESFGNITLRTAIENLNKHQNLIADRYFKDFKKENISLSYREMFLTYINVNYLEKHLRESPKNDILEELHAISSFLLGISIFGERLAGFTDIASNLQNKKILYIPFLWNYKKKADEEHHRHRSSGAENEKYSNIKEEYQNEKETLQAPKLIEGYEALLEMLTKRNVASVVKAFEWSEKAWKHVLGRIIFSFKGNSYKYAFRAASTVTLVALFGFLEDTKIFFQKWRLGWALFTIPLVMTPTLGGSTSIGLWRIIGTFFGGLYALLVWETFPSISSYGPIHFILSICFAIPCQYIRICTKYKRLGLVMLITFTSVFYGNMIMEIQKQSDPTMQDSDSVLTLMFKRTLAISAGTLISILSTAVIFPVFAKGALRTKMGGIMNLTSQMFSKIMDKLNREGNEERTSLNQFLSLEVLLQSNVLECQELIELAATEIALDETTVSKPITFQKEKYERALSQCQKIIDQMLTCRIIIFQGFSDAFKDSVLIPMKYEKRMLVGSLMLYFSVFSGCIRSRMPLAPLLPDLEKARLLYYTKFRQLYSHSADLSGANFLFIANCMKAIVRDTYELVKCMSELYGIHELDVIDQNAEEVAE